MLCYDIIIIIIIITCTKEDMFYLAFVSLSVR